jgi:ribosomal-protein-alanine N-acetyltransferase
MQAKVEIQTKRLLIREFIVNDWPAVHVYGIDPEVFRFQHWGPNTENDSLEFIQLALRQQSESPRNSFELAIVEKQEKLLIGAVGIRIKSLVNRDADMG